MLPQPINFGMHNTHNRVLQNKTGLFNFNIQCNFLLHYPKETIKIYELNKVYKTLLPTKICKEYLNAFSLDVLRELTERTFSSLLK